MNDHNVFSIYRFGSHVYGTNTEHSDEDFIIVVDKFFDTEDINIQAYTTTQFQHATDNHEIQALECLFVGFGLTIKEEFRPKFTLDVKKLRPAISTITSNSYVKGKKKLIIAGDYEPHLAIKSVFHSFRILDFGIQIAQHGSIIDYKSMNWLLADLKKMSALYQRQELWDMIETKYKSTFNTMNTAFKKLCPKDLTEKDQKIQLEKTLSKHGVVITPDMTSEILKIFQK